MVTIRLARGGAKKRPFYHIVVTDSRRARDGRFIERLGYFNPIATGRERRLSLNTERASWWIGRGAKPSDRVASLIGEAKKAPVEAVAPEQAVAEPVSPEAAPEPQVESEIKAAADESAEPKAKAEGAKPVEAAGDGEAHKAAAESAEATAETGNVEVDANADKSPEASTGEASGETSPDEADAPK